MMQSNLPLLGHLRVLRGVLFRTVLWIGLGGGVVFALFDAVVGVFLQLFPHTATHNSVFMHHIFEGFSVRLKLSAIGGIVLASPAWVLDWLTFIIPGLKRRERVWLLAGLLAAVVLAVLGAVVAYRVILPLSIQILTGFSFVPDSVGVMLNYQHSVLYAVKFVAYSVLVFQFPIVLMALMGLGVLKRRSLLKASRYSVIGIFIVSAILTPPDIVSQLGLAAPLVGLYGATVLIAYALRIGS
jgi:sec-independent protein translocase protein TatC